MAEKPKGPKKDDPEQSQRFVEAAESLGTEKSGSSFERAMKTVVPVRPTPPKGIPPEKFPAAVKALDKLIDLKEQRLANLTKNKTKK